MTRDEVEHEESTTKVILTQGPVVFNREEEQQQSGGKFNMYLTIIENLIEKYSSTLMSFLNLM